VNEILDLGNHPPSNSYLTKSQLYLPEITYPLKLFVCSECWLVQLPEHVKPDNLFTPEYAYFSSTSSSWCNHAKDFANKVTDKLDLKEGSFVLEIASNDGYLLQYFNHKNIQCLGIEPTIQTAIAAEKKGINTVKKFFGYELSLELKNEELIPKNGCDLIVANNVLAHVPDIKDFIKGISNILSERGTFTVEFPSVRKLIQFNQFDTIYHEHYSYLSLNFIKKLCNNFELNIYDVENLNTHGGSLRVWITKNKKIEVSQNVNRELLSEINFGLNTLRPYENLQINAEKVKISLLDYLISKKKENLLVSGYGAAAKANTLLNFSGIKSDLIPFIADKAKSKQNLYMPGSHIPIISPKELEDKKIDNYIIFPWNLINEISLELKEKNLITFIPTINKW
jgi:cyclopropane fatty-acyl-phospholipid synthase-like methyltransferase